MKESAFVITLGKSPKIKIIDFFLESNTFDYTKSEVAEQTGISRVTLNVLWPELIKTKFLIPRRRIANAVLYGLNNNSSIVKKLKELDFFLSKELGEKVINKQNTRKKLLAVQ